MKNMVCHTAIGGALILWLDWTFHHLLNIKKECIRLARGSLENMEQCAQGFWGP